MSLKDEYLSERIRSRQDYKKLAGLMKQIVDNELKMRKFNKKITKRIKYFRKIKDAEKVSKFKKLRTDGLAQYEKKKKVLKKKRKTIRNATKSVPNSRIKKQQGKSIHSTIADKAEKRAKRRGAKTAAKGIKWGWKQKGGATLIAAAIIGGSYMYYKRNLSQAARACKKHSGWKKDQCMDSFRIKIIQDRIKRLRGNRHKCDTSKDPVLCKQKIDIEISKLETKLSKM